MSGLLAQATLGVPPEPPASTAGAPPGAPPEGPRFQSALDAEWARTAPAEGQRQTSPSEVPRTPATVSETAGEEAHARELHEAAAGPARPARARHEHSHRRESAADRPRPAAAANGEAPLTGPADAVAEPTTPGASVAAQSAESSAVAVAGATLATTAADGGTAPSPGSSTPGESAGEPLAAPSPAAASPGVLPGEQPEPDPAAALAPATADASTTSSPGDAGATAASDAVDTTSTTSASSGGASSPTRGESSEALAGGGQAGAATGSQTAAASPPSEATPAPAGSPAIGASDARTAAPGAATPSRAAHGSAASSKSTAAAGASVAPATGSTTTAADTRSGAGETGYNGDRQAKSAALTQTPAPSRPAASAGLDSLLGAAPSSSTQSASSSGGAAAPASYGVELHQTIEAVNATIDLAARQGLTQARIELSPEELGEIRIHLTQSSAGLSARVTAESPAAAQALAAGHTELRQSLRALGLTLTRLDIGHHNSLSTAADGRDSGARDTPRGEVVPRRADGARVAAAADADPLTTDAEPAAQAQASPVEEPGALVDVLA